MKRILAVFACTFAVALGFAGCKDSGTVNTNPTLLPYKVGDLFTYESYLRDSVTDVNIAASKTIRKWTVLQTNLTFQNKTGVTQFDEIIYAADGVTPVGRDTLYMGVETSGKIWMYDMVGGIMRPLIKSLLPTLPDSILKSIPAVWMQLSDVKQTGTATWISAGQTQFTVPVVVVPGTPPTNVPVVVSMNADHKGKQSVTAAGATYPSSVHTDHTVLVQSTIVNDSAYVRADVDSKDGLLRQVVNSKSINTLLGPRKVPGTDLVLIGIVRK